MAITFSFVIVCLQRNAAICNIRISMFLFHILAFLKHFSINATQVDFQDLEHTTCLHCYYPLPGYHSSLMREKLLQLYWSLGFLVHLWEFHISVILHSTFSSSPLISCQCLFLAFCFASRSSLSAFPSTSFSVFLSQYPA